MIQCQEPKIFRFQLKLDVNECHWLATVVSSNPFNFVNDSVCIFKSGKYAVPFFFWAHPVYIQIFPGFFMLFIHVLFLLLLL